MSRGKKSSGSRGRPDKGIKIPRETCLIDVDAAKPVAVALAFPNTYRVGMANLGFQGVYHLINEHPRAYAERLFLPAPVMSGGKRTQKDAAPVTIESGRSAPAFDIIAFSVSFEEDYPHIVRMLHRSGLHPLREKRGRDAPLVVVGGTAVMINPAPLLQIADVMPLGDGRLLLPVLLDTFDDAGRGHKADFLERLSGRDGFLVPGRRGGRKVPADASGGEGLLVLREKPAAGTQPVSSVCITPGSEFGLKGLIELTRGCDRRCAFCWGGHNCGPFFTFSRDKILAYADRIAGAARGLGLVTMSAASYPDLPGLLEALRGRSLEVGLSSLRFEGLTARLAGEIVRAGQKTATLAPEAGTEKLRRTIHKQLSDEVILEKCGLLFRAGLKHMKLYFLVGLPGEARGDLEGIIELVGQIHRLMVAEGRKRGRLGDLHISVNCFIPKPHTPLQDAPMDNIKTLREKIAFLRQALSSFSNLRLTAMSPHAAHVQGLLSRGGDGLTPLLLEAGLNTVTWRQAARRAGADMESENCRRREADEKPFWKQLKTVFTEKLSGP
jgi:radical SAM superfamily enzyme YgiQ (UPF0313 family)